MIKNEDRPLCVAMLGHKRIPTREGGIEIVVKELAVRMAQRGVHVDVFNRWDLGTKGGKVGDKTYQGVRIYQVPTLHNGKLNAFLYSVLATIRVSFKRYDVLHYHAIGSCAMLWLPHLLGKKTVATVHGLDWQRAKWSRFATFYLKLGEKMAAKYADEIIVLSSGNQRYFEETYHRETRLIPNGMEWHKTPKPDKILQQYGLHGKDYVLFLARIVPEKGLHYLLDAFLQVKTDKHLVIAGGLDEGDEYCKRILALAKRDSRVILAGFVQGQELEELFGNCSVYVLPSDVEGMPISLLEAISYKVRCLVSDIEENVEAGKGVVSTFHHGNVDSLRDELTALLQQPDQPLSLPENAWISWEDVTTQTLALYQEVIRSNAKEKGLNA